MRTIYCSQSQQVSGRRAPISAADSKINEMIFRSTKKLKQVGKFTNMEAMG